MITTDVLVVGCGPSGLVAALALARSGVAVLAITKHSELSPTPRAHLTNQRSLEVLADLGVGDTARALAIPYSFMPDASFMRSLTGDEFGRMRGLGADYEGLSNSRQASPYEVSDLPQHILEPMLFGAAVKAGCHVRFDTELVTFDQDGEGVTAVLRDRLSDERMEVRCRYMIGADGGRSLVAATLGLPMEGQPEIGGSLNILFDADLTAYVAHRPALLYFMVRHAQDPGGAGMSILRTVKPWTQWMIIRGYAAGEESPRLSEEDAVEVVRSHLGVADLDVQITGLDPWMMNAVYARSYQEGRVICMGDAVHRHVPSAGLGSNTGMQDAYNLAWKLALVVKGAAGAGLLDTYSAERVPVGRQVVEHATGCLPGYDPILAALGVQGAVEDAAELLAASPSGTERRRRLRDALAGKASEFRPRGVELNQHYRSAAVLDDGEGPLPSGPDPVRLYQPTTRPGARVPHAWVQRDGRSVTTLDLVGQGRFTVLTGVGGMPWTEAAAWVSHELGVDVSAVAIGPGCDYEDLYFTWSDLREIEEDGCLLVRPDGHVGWRHRRGVSSERARVELSQALCRVLDR